MSRGPVVRRLLIVLLFGLVLTGGAAVTWQAMGRARLVEEDLTTARALLAGAGGFESGQLKQRLRLVRQAEQHTVSAQHRLGQRWDPSEPDRELATHPTRSRRCRPRRWPAPPSAPGAWSTTWPTGTCGCRPQV